MSKKINFEQFLIVFFFCNYYDNNNIYSMNLDGSNCKPIYYGECYDLCIVNNKIYFSQGVRSRELYSFLI